MLRGTGQWRTALSPGNEEAPATDLLLGLVEAPVQSGSRSLSPRGQLLHACRIAGSATDASARILAVTGPDRSTLSPHDRLDRGWVRVWAPSWFGSR